MLENLSMLCYGFTNIKQALDKNSSLMSFSLKYYTTCFPMLSEREETSLSVNVFFQIAF